MLTKDELQAIRQRFETVLPSLNSVNPNHAWNAVVNSQADIPALLSHIEELEAILANSFDQGQSKSRGITDQNTERS